MRHSQVAASFGRRPLVTIRPRELLEGVLELLVRLNDHGPLLLLSQLIAKYPHRLVAGKRIRTLLGNTTLTLALHWRSGIYDFPLP